MTRRQRERAFQSTIEGALEAFGYVWDHTYPLRTEHGWRTGSSLDGKPDLLAWRPPRMLAIEVKAGREKPTALQVAVLSLMAEIPCCRAWVISDQDPPWDDFVRWVRRPKLAPQTYGFEPVPNPRVAIAREQREARARKAAARERRALRKTLRTPATS